MKKRNRSNHREILQIVLVIEFISRHYKLSGLYYFISWRRLDKISSFIID